MINLLPPETKENIAYARHNLKLIKWITATIFGIIGIFVVVFGSYLYINDTTKVYASEVQKSKDDLAVQKLAETQKRVEEISSSTKLTFQVLSRQILFSKLLEQIGTVMPEGSALQSLSINKLEGGIDLQAVAVDEQTATQVQINLKDPANKVFEKADILNISCQESTTSTTTSNLPDSKYKCQISIRALFSKNGAFLFTNNPKSDGSL